MQIGSLEHALFEIEKRQRELALQQLLTPNVDGKDSGYVFGLSAGRVQGLQTARSIILDILNPKDIEKKPHAR
jgi:hypothetical protein